MNETIAAISTAFTNSAIGIIRISGKKSLPLVSQLLHRKGVLLDKKLFQKNPRKSIYCDLFFDGSVVDQIIAIYYKKPHSYTGEDIFELHLHGNVILLKKTLAHLFKLGIVPAARGEFTKRAFLSKKINLNYAEAVNRLIQARSELELQVAQKNMTGAVGRITSNIRSKLISLKAECEAEIDFSTEDLTYQTLEQRKDSILSLQNFCYSLVQKTQILNQYIRYLKVVLYGEPNTGKSSLMNELLGNNRSIVSQIEGTTRDYITEELNLKEIKLKLVDTAGIRTSTGDQIEQLGVERSNREFKSADFILYVIDISRDVNIKKIQDEIKKPDLSIIVANKVDLNKENWYQIQKDLQKKFTVIETSCKTKQGINQLREEIYKKLTSLIKNLKMEEFVFLEERNIYYIEKIIDHLKTVLQLIQNNVPVEIYIKEIDDCLNVLSKITRPVENEEILGRIFSNFCVGK